MKITVAKRAGFCFGVKRAVDIAFKLAENSESGLFSLGPLIHNPQVIERLREQGVTPIDELHSPDIKTLIIRTHGISPAVYKEISKEEYNIVDATCPFVKKAQKHVQELRAKGFQVLIVGDRAHPEVQALLGFGGDNVIVLKRDEPLPRLKGRVGIVAQTTQPLEALKDVVCKVIGSVKEVKIYNTICDSTALRLEETRKLAGDVDFMIVVGGKNSANTGQLSHLSRGLCAKVYHIETAAEIQEEWFNGSERVGITGGASTPQWLIDEVVEKIEEISCR